MAASSGLRIRIKSCKKLDCSFELALKGNKNKLLNIQPCKRNILEMIYRPETWTMEAGV